MLYQGLDEVRRVARHEPARLFRRAVPTVDYLVLLSQAQVLRSPAVEETDCRIDFETGELLCTHSGAPGKDCRLASCRHAALMRMRLLGRLGVAYARERRRRVGI